MRCGVVVLVDNNDKLVYHHIDVAVIIGVGIGAVKVVVLSGGDWRHEGGRRSHPKIPTRRVKPEAVW